MEELLAGKVGFPGPIEEQVRVLWHPAHRPAGGHLAVVSAGLQVLAGVLGSGILKEELVHEAGSLVVEELEAAEVTSSTVFLRVVLCLLNGDIGPRGQLVKSLREGEVFVGHHESHRIPALAAAKAAIGLSAGADIKGGSLFVVKGTVGFEVGARPLEIQPVGRNEVHDVGRAEDLLDDFIWDAGHRHVILADPGRLPIHLGGDECEEM